MTTTTPQPATVPERDSAAWNAAWKKLEHALQETPLRRMTGGFSHASVDEFMFMPSSMPGHWAFKHRDSRNYLFIHMETGAMNVPDEFEAFRRGEF